MEWQMSRVITVSSPRPEQRPPVWTHSLERRLCPGDGRARDVPTWPALLSGFVTMKQFYFANTQPKTYQDDPLSYSFPLSQNFHF